MNRTVGLTLRRTAGAGMVFVLGFGSISVAPHQVVPAAASTPAPSFTDLPLMSSNEVDHRVRPIALVSPVVSAPPRPPAQPTVGNAANLRPGPKPRPQLVKRMVVKATVSVHRASRSADASAFAYGYCTWWVAQKRDIPWRGDAAQWWWNARAFGFAEGQVPRVGAIMVMAAGGAASSVGHVAYVEKVNANGTFVVSEMNWWGVPGGGWGRVDYRTVTSMRGILGFIY